jgi:cytochrome c oxidase subunit I
VPSPPPVHNFDEVPVVRHRDDFWHTKYVEIPEGAPRRVFAGGAHDDDAGDHGHSIHLPSPSYFPVLAAAGLPIMAYGVIYNDLAATWPLIVGGALLSLLSFFGWILEPSVEE